MPGTHDLGRVVPTVAEGSPLIARGKARSSESRPRHGHAGKVRLAALEEIATALAMTRAPEDVAMVVTRVAAKALGAAVASIRMLRGDGLLVRLAEPGGAPSHEPLVGYEISVDAADMLADAVRRGIPVRVETPEEWAARYPDVWRTIQERGLQAAIALPLQVQGRTIGVLRMSFAQPHCFTVRERSFIGAVAGLTVQALDRARLHIMEQERAQAAEELARIRQQQAEEARAIAAMSSALTSTLEPSQLYAVLLEQTAKALPCDHAAVVLHADGWAILAATWGDPHQSLGTRLFRLADDDPTLEATLSAGRAMLIRDTADMPTWITIPPFTGASTIRSVLFVPLRLEGRLVGTLNVASFRPGFYSRRHVALAVRFAEHVAHAMLNARLYQAEQQRARAAEALVRLRDGFVASISHELRTPLTAIIGYGELLEAHWEKFDDAQRRKRISSIVAAANRLQRLVADLLLLNQLETEVLVPHCHPVLLAPLIRQAVEEVQGSYAGQIVELDGPETARVNADPDRTLQILANLTDNAAKYSAEGCAIVITWEIAGSDVVLRVRDTGPGIPDKGGEHLFTRFGRVPNSKVRAGHVGTGLGLYLGRLLARAMLGDLELEATGPQGSVFCLRLPQA